MMDEARLVPVEDLKVGKTYFEDYILGTETQEVKVVKKDGQTISFRYKTHDLGSRDITCGLKKLSRSHEWRYWDRRPDDFLREQTAFI